MIVNPINIYNAFSIGLYSTTNVHILQVVVSLLYAFNCTY